MTGEQMMWVDLFLQAVVQAMGWAVGLTLAALMGGVATALFLCLRALVRTGRNVQPHDTAW